jgi:hypothetical protein
VLLSQLTSSAPRLALVGLAKNTGKTVALAALLGELRSAGRIVGVTSVGRDGEEHDVIDSRIEKPAVRLWSGCLIATTDGLLRGSGIPHELLEQTDVRTPLGRVLIARLRGHGAIEVAGPSIAAEVRAVSDAMLAHGAEQILIDGAIDRRAASSPAVADALVISTGAILSEDIDQVVARTAEAVQLVRLPTLSADPAIAAKIRELAQRGDLGAGLLIAQDPGQFAALPARFVLTADPPLIDGFLREGLVPRWLLVGGALPEAFLNGLVPFVRRSGRPLTVLVSDPTHVFIAQRGVDFYTRAGISIQTLTQIDLRAMTVNPVAPQSHSFDSAELQRLLAQAIPALEIFDVMDPSYAATAAALGAAGRDPG